MASTAYCRGLDVICRYLSCRSGSCSLSEHARQFDQTFSYEGKMSINPAANSYTASAHAAALNRC